MKFKFYWTTDTLICRWLLFATMVQLNSCKSDYMAHKPKIFTIWPFPEKVADPWLRESPQYQLHELESGNYLWQRVIFPRWPLQHFPSYLFFYNVTTSLPQQNKDSNSLPFESGLILVTCLANVRWWKWLLRLPRLGRKKPCSFLLGLL